MASGRWSTQVPILEPAVQTMPRLLTAVKVMGCLAIFFHSTIACMALDPPGPPGPPGGNPPPPPPLWLIQSPAAGAQIPRNAQLACSGTAATDGVTWLLKVKNPSTNVLLSDVKANLSGSSANNSWSGTAVSSTRTHFWLEGPASATLKVGGDVKDEVDFVFVAPDI